MSIDFAEVSIRYQKDGRGGSSGDAAIVFGGRVLRAEALLKTDCPAHCEGEPPARRIDLDIARIDGPMVTVAARLDDSEDGSAGEGRVRCIIVVETETLLARAG